MILKRFQGTRPDTDADRFVDIDEPGRKRARGVDRATTTII